MAKPYEEWIEEMAKFLEPKRIYFADGSEDEARRLVEIAMREEKIEGKPVLYELNHALWPNAYLHRSHPSDTARTEHLTYVCHPEKEKSGPNNNWMDPKSAKDLLTNLSRGCMKGKTMYVLPYMMGHPDSPYAKACIQLTDISYVAISMRIMTRLGKFVLEKIGNSPDFVRGIHSVLDFDINKRFIMHFPDENLVWSVGSGYGGNALLGKKCFSLRIASWLGYKQKWLAEHMIIIGVEDPDGDVTYIAGAFPSACGKTNLALLESKLEGYKVWTIGDDIAWLNIGPDGRLYAINPETGYFGVAPGTSHETNPNMIRTLKHDGFFPVLYTNTGLDVKANEPWWEGLKEPPTDLLDWQGNPWKKESGLPCAHPNSRFTVSIYNTPNLSSEFDNPQGVPISAIIFGGRRSELVPLVCESFDWVHGVFLAARMGSETTAAAEHKIGVLRRDPFAMLPFCGYNMADYFSHWIEMGRMLKNPPRIFSVNWFRKDENGNFIWPGFGENIRVLKWIVDRVKGRCGAKETPIGLLPHIDDLEISGLEIDKAKLEKIISYESSGWESEVREIKEFFSKFGERIPIELKKELERLERSVSGKIWTR
ncbi:MAG: phosphoenolpyruvate carboxykinase (GTP) [Desulfobacterota bacterium]|nr:phosphoenolpyruvate carboxykinase (GTP) [Thermodesulfobacteriota bacterium]